MDSITSDNYANNSLMTFSSFIHWDSDRECQVHAYSVCTLIKDYKLKK